MKIKLLFSIICISVFSNGFSQWVQSPAINTPVCVQPHRQDDARIVSDSKSGAIITWTDYRVDSIHGDIYVQRMNAAGYPMWTANGVGVCTDTNHQSMEYMCQSENGAAIIVWEDNRNADRDIYAQKVDSLGNILWTANGVAVCSKIAKQKNPRVMSDGVGGAFVVWEDSVGGTFDIYAQRVSSTGVNLWTAGGIPICNAAGIQGGARIATDGFGGAIIAWQDKRGFIDNFIYAQRVDASGNVKWTANGAIICNTPGGQINPKLIADGNHGAYLAWQDKRNGDDYDIYAQRIDSTGTIKWGQFGNIVCSAIFNQSAIDMTADHTDGTIIAWKDERNSIYQIFANRVRGDGSKPWVNNGILLGTGINPNTDDDASGGAVIAWQDSTSTNGTWDVFSQRIDSTGAKLWLATGDSVSIADGGQTGPKNISTGDGGSIYTWVDKRSGDHDIYAHRMVGHHSYAGIYEYKDNAYSISCYPNPFNTQTTILINSEKTIKSWKLNIYDASGKMVMTQEMSNTNKALINKGNLSEGYYFYQAISNTEVLGRGNFVITQ